MGDCEFWDSFQCALLLPAWELGGPWGGGCGGKKGLPGVTQPLCPFLRALLPPPAKVSAFTPVRKNEKWNTWCCSYILLVYLSCCWNVFSCRTANLPIIRTHPHTTCWPPFRQIKPTIKVQKQAQEGVELRSVGGERSKEFFFWLQWLWMRLKEAWTCSLLRLSVKSRDPDREIDWSLQTASVPGDCEVTVSIYALIKGAKSDETNYGPADLTSVLGKENKSLIKDSIVQHLDKKNPWGSKPAQFL